MVKLQSFNDTCYRFLLRFFTRLFADEKLQGLRVSDSMKLDIRGPSETLGLVILIIRVVMAP